MGLDRQPAASQPLPHPVPAAGVSCPRPSSDKGQLNSLLSSLGVSVEGTGISGTPELGLASPIKPGDKLNGFTSQKIWSWKTRSRKASNM